MGNLVNQLAFPAPDPRYSQPFLEERSDLVRFPTREGKKIFAVDMRCENGYFQRPYTVLYSHGNAEDVGLALPYLEELLRMTDCSVFAYEYAGYSLTDGQPSEQGCYDSIDAAYEFLTKVKKIPSDCIFIFGRSIGSGPSTDLASRVGAKGCAGLILQSPLESGARAVFGNTVATVGTWLDIFKNIEKVDTVQVPVCIIHGEMDEVVPVTNGKNLFKKLHARGMAATPLWIPGRGHNNMPERDCLAHTRNFIEHVVKQQTKAAGIH